ncbi:hypothetical protein A6K24_25395 [Metabacillus litoralis]|uniref:Uncharacterized protein n=1 Tax=Metabacillus litoralis TaxID=152268 RepID=A0A179SW30_9BACI|nr:hypothetical protein A6K24_25395 [Metabacillus litoralis]
MRPRRRFALRRLIARPTESEHPGAPINQTNTILKATKFAKTFFNKDILLWTEKRLTLTFVSTTAKVETLPEPPLLTHYYFT